MGDYDKYYELLAKDASDNTLSGFAGVANSLAPSIVSYSQQPDADLGESLLYGSILGLLGGGLSQLGQNQANEQLSLANKVLLGSAETQNPSLDPSLYSRAKSYRDLIAASKAQEIRDKVIDKRLDITAQDIKDTNKNELDLDYISKKKLAEEDALQLLSGQTEEPGILTSFGKEVRSIEDEASKDIENLPSVEKLRMVRGSLAELKSLAPLDSASSDIPFTTLFIQALDGSVVREGEYARAEGANPLIAAWKNRLEGTLNGESSLGPPIKMQMYNELLLRANDMAQLAERDINLRKDRAAQYSANPEKIGNIDTSIDYDPLVGQKAEGLPPGYKVQRNKSTGAIRLVPMR